MENIKGIIFDYGGTIDSHGDHWSEVIWDGYRDAGVDVSKADFRDAYVETERELARTRHILPHHNFYDLLLIKMKLELGVLISRGLLLPDNSESLAVAIAEYCYDRARSSVEDARPVLETLHKHYPMVLVSNFYGNVESVLEDFGLRRYFGHIVESAVVGVRKPDPAIFALGVDALGMQPQQVLVVGDSLRKDILAEKLTFEEAVMRVSQDKDTRFSRGIMVNGQNGTVRFEMSQLPQEVGKVVNRMEVGEISEPFIMKDPKRDRDIVAMVKLTARVDAHKANLADDYQLVKNMYENAEKSEIVKKWVDRKIKETYVKVEDGWRGCEFKHEGWIKK